MTASLDSLQKHFKIHSGRFREVEVNLCAVVRDEMFLMPAFFEHYRRLGVEQFVILDDKSQDGTLDFLSNQADCVVLSSDLRYGQHIDVVYPDGSVAKNQRAGPILKSVMGRTFLRNRYALFVDGDEFLILSEGLSKLGEVFSTLRANHVRSLAANMVEFYPRSLESLEDDAAPKSFTDLIALYPYFDAVPLLQMRPGKRPITIAGSATYRLFDTINPKVMGPLSRLRALLGIAKSRKIPNADKTPILLWGDDVWIRGGHSANIAPTSKALLVLAHFKLTHDFAQKVQRAVEWKAHCRRAERYSMFDLTLNRIRGRNKDFLCASTQKFTGPAQLVDCGLLKWELTDKGEQDYLKLNSSDLPE